MNLKAFLIYVLKLLNLKVIILFSNKRIKNLQAMNQIEKPNKLFDVSIVSEEIKSNKFCSIDLEDLNNDKIHRELFTGNEICVNEEKNLNTTKLKRGCCGAGAPCLFIPEILTCLTGICTLITPIILALIPCFIAAIPLIITVLTIVLPIVLTQNNNTSG